MQLAVPAKAGTTTWTSAQRATQHRLAAAVAVESDPHLLQWALWLIWSWPAKVVQQKVQLVRLVTIF